MAEIDAPGTRRPSDSAEKAPLGLDLAKLGEINGIEDLIQQLKKGDWMSMVGAIMTLWKEYFGTPEEKAEIKRAKESAQKKEKAREHTQSGLADLRRDVDDAERPATSEERHENEPVLDPDLGDGREFVFIGDSAANSMHLSYAPGMRPDFIGKDGMSTFQVIERLKAEKNRLRNKKRAVIYCAGNNILGTSTNQLVNHMIEMAKICRDADVPEIIVNTQLPRDGRYAGMLGTERYDELRHRSDALRQELLKAYKEGRFPPGTKVVDLLKPFSDEKGNMKERFVDPRTGDYIHTRIAYKSAVDYMMRSA